MKPIITALTAFFAFLLLPLNMAGQENILTIRTPSIEINTPSELDETNSQTTIQYFDVAGRLVQNLRKDASSGMDDLADYIVYDSLGCKATEYLSQPFPDNNGAFVPETSFAEKNSWKKTYRYEASVKHRIIGARGLHYGGREVTYSYRLNSSSVPELSAFRLTLSGDAVQCTLAADGVYHVSETCDEDGHRVLVFSDNYRRNILTRKINGSEFYDTYYVYDLLDRPVCVLPPTAVAGFSSGNNYSLAKGDAPYLYCYRYEYDGRNRKTGIKRPGADWEYIIYDGEDRPILTQSGNQRARNEWDFTKYDGLGRVILQGSLSTNLSRETLASQWSEVAVQEAYTGTGPSLGYSNNHPLTNGAFTITTAFYYDTYDFTSFPWTGISRPDAPSPAKGLLTGRYEAVLNCPDKGKITMLCYDTKARLVKEESYNSLTDKSASHQLSYNFSGLPVWEEYGFNDSIFVTYEHHYNQSLQKTATYYKLKEKGSSIPSYSTILFTNGYDVYARLSEKIVLNKNLRTEYNYYPDGTLRNLSAASGFSQTLYKGRDETLPYDFPRCYNGNISDIQVDQQGEQAFWHYEYDGVDRLLSAIKYSASEYQKPLGEKEHYTYDRMGNITQLLRDHRKVHVAALTAAYSGNQLVKVSDGGVHNVDYDYQSYPDLEDKEQEYYYDKDGNQTTNLDKDIVTVRYNSLNLPDTIQMGNGNRIIHYYLSGGERIRTVSRTYTTALSVPRDVVTTSNDPHKESVETHLGSLIYKDGEPNRLLSDVGYWLIQKNPTSGKLNFRPFAYICDYLGSVRLVCEGATGNVMQNLEYLPSGLICNSMGYDLQPNKFTGKELLSMHGLNQYDSKARMQEFQLPGFTTQDPLSENYYDWTPYGYCMGNPVKYVDPDGEAVETVWDIYSLATGVKSFVDNVKAGNVVGAIVDGVGVVADAVAVAVPGVPGGAGAAIKGFRALDKAADVAKTVQKTYQTYTKTNPKTGEVYTGRTSGKNDPKKNVESRDKNHHKNKEGFGHAVLDQTSSDPDAIRGREQQMIDKNGGAKSQGGTSGNTINGVSPENPRKEQYLKKSRGLFGMP